MAWWKQILIIVALGAAGFFGWARFDPQAAARLHAMGLDPALVKTMAGSSTGDSTSSVQPRGRFGSSREVFVVTDPVFTAQIENSVTAIGDGEALKSVGLVPLESGVLTRINIAPGDQVSAGDVIAELDSQTQTVARDRAALQQRLAADKLARMERLNKSRTVSTVQVDDARGELQTAELALRDAEIDLQRRLIVAPADGIAGLVPVEEGAYVTSDTIITTIDDRTSLIVDFWVPERFAALIGRGDKVEAEAVAFPGKSFDGVVSQIASRVDRDSRTLQIRGQIPNTGDRLRPGMSFRVTMNFPSDSHIAVSPLAIQWSSQGPYVWLDNGGKAKRINVSIIQRNSDAVMISGDLNAGDMVVIEGIQSVRDGSTLKIAGAPPGEEA